MEEGANCEIKAYIYFINTHCISCYFKLSIGGETPVNLPANNIYYFRYNFTLAQEDINYMVSLVL